MLDLSNTLISALESALRRSELDDRERDDVVAQLDLAIERLTAQPLLAPAERAMVERLEAVVLGLRVSGASVVRQSDFGNLQSA